MNKLLAFGIFALVFWRFPHETMIALAVILAGLFVIAIVFATGVYHILKEKMRRCDSCGQVLVATGYPGREKFVCTNEHCQIRQRWAEARAEALDRMTEHEEKKGGESNG